MLVEMYHKLTFFLQTGREGTAKDADTGLEGHSSSISASTLETMNKVDGKVKVSSRDLLKLLHRLNLYASSRKYYYKYARSLMHLPDMSFVKSLLVLILLWQKNWVCSTAEVQALAATLLCSKYWTETLEALVGLLHLYFYYNVMDIMYIGGI